MDRKQSYDAQVTDEHNVKASDFLANKEKHEAKIRQLEEIE